MVFFSLEDIRNRIRRILCHSCSQCIVLFLYGLSLRIRITFALIYPLHWYREIHFINVNVMNRRSFLLKHFLYLLYQLFEFLDHSVDLCATPSRLTTLHCDHCVSQTLRSTSKCSVLFLLILWVGYVLSVACRTIKNNLCQ